MPWPQLIKANSPDIKSSDTLQVHFQVSIVPQIKAHFSKIEFFEMARLGYFLWTTGSLKASTICSFVAKVTNDLPCTSPWRWKKSAGCGQKLDGCENLQNNTDLQLGLREQGVATTIPHNLDARSHTPFNPRDTCGLDTLQRRDAAKPQTHSEKQCQTFERSSP